MEHEPLEESRGRRGPCGSSWAVFAASQHLDRVGSAGVTRRLSLGLTDPTGILLAMGVRQPLEPCHGIGSVSQRVGELVGHVDLPGQVVPSNRNADAVADTDAEGDLLVLPQPNPRHAAVAHGGGAEGRMIIDSHRDRSPTTTELGLRIEGQADPATRASLDGNEDHLELLHRPSLASNKQGRRPADARGLGSHHTDSALLGPALG